MIISERIFYMMEKKNMTQLELSKRTGIATSNISDWKKKKTNPKADCLLSICDALEITPEQLFLYEGNKRAWEYMKELGYEMKLEESSGDHQWKYWDAKIQDVLRWWLDTDLDLT